MIYTFIFLGLLLSIFTRKYNNSLFILFSITLLLLGCFRAQYIGTDTAHGYKTMFSYFEHGYDVSYLDKGWILVNKISVALKLGYQGVLAIAELLCVCPVIYVINKVSKNKCLSLFIYYASFIYLHSYNIIRQCIAMSFCLLVFYFFINKKYVYSIVFMICAFFFHKTSLIFLAVFIFMKLKINLRRIILFCLISFGLGLVCNKSLFIKIAGPYAFYLEGSSFGFRDDMKSAIFMSFLVTLFFILYVLMIGEKKLQTEWLKSYLLGVCCMNVTMSMLLGTRIIYYFTQFQIFFYTDYIITKRKEKYLYLFVLILYYSLIFYKIFLGQYSEINPYNVFLLD